ncbi:MAG: hypothetical protein DRO52_01600 [Candidatus Hecatellales archaeon]|nr:MAG: hypothetical protein DRO52_01600 [Candidatus Hecatellales archaeon]
MRDGLTAAGIVLSIVLLLCVFSVAAKPFPVQSLGSPPLIAKTPAPPEAFSSALWEIRSWDAVILSLVLLFSAIGCIALFRLEER